MKIEWNIYSLLIFFILLDQTNGAKILLISPNLSNSMVLYSGRIADVLHKAGHDVTLFIPEMRSNTKKINGTRLGKVIRMENLGDDFDNVMSEYSDPFSVFKESPLRRRSEMIAMAHTCEAILKRFDEVKYLRSYRFDLAITNNVDFCDIALTRAWDIPIHIWTTTGPILDINSWAIGIPPETSYVPIPWENQSGPIMTLMERIFNLFHLWTDRLIAYEHTWRITQLFRRYIDPNFPYVYELAAQSSLLFVNADEFIEPSRSVPSKVIHIGGVGLAHAESLTGTEFGRFQNTTDNLILFSLGSAAFTRFINPETKRQIIETFGQFSNYQFIVKADTEDEVFKELADKTPNVHLFDWIPQMSLLALPKMSLFITHGGYNSIIEGITNGVPLLLLPLFFDQHRNSKAMEYRKVARILSPHLINTDTLKRELSTLLNNKIYSENAQRFARLHRTKPNQPDGTLVKWVDFVLQNGALPELNPELLHLNWFTSSHLDIYCLLFLTLCAVLIVAKRLFNVLMPVNGKKKKLKTN